jgi:hypothetical protein
MERRMIHQDSTSREYRIKRNLDAWKNGDIVVNYDNCYYCYKGCDGKKMRRFRRSRSWKKYRLHQWREK